ADGVQHLVVDNDMPVDEKSFVRFLPSNVTWAWYGQDIPSLLAVDLAMADTIPKRNVKSVDRFFKDLEDAKSFPNVAWIDPNFIDIGSLEADFLALLRAIGDRTDDGKLTHRIENEVVELNAANSDQPPADVMHGQAFLQVVISALMQSPVWN